METYKGYLSRQYHDEFDRWAAEFHDGWGEFDQNVGEGADPAIRFGAASFLSEYNWDSPRRLQHLEQDGVVAEVVYPNTVPPFYPAAVLSAPHPAPADYPLRWAGLQAHNRWLVDFCNEVPGRRKGLAQVFFNDVDAAVKEIHWAKEHGLAGILIPGDHHKNLVQLYEPRLDPIWAACAELSMPIHRHGSNVADANEEGGPSAPALGTYEAMYHSYLRALPHMTIGGVFHRHPDLKLVFTEGRSGWVPTILQKLDAYYKVASTEGTIPFAVGNPAIKDHEMLPSEYFQRNCYIASFLTAGDMDIYNDIGGADHIMWGSDYPHHEATWPNSTIALRMNFHDIPEDDVRKMTSATAAGLYGFDLDFLQPLADKFGPSVETLRRPVPQDEVPWPSMCPTFQPSEFEAAATSLAAANV